MSYTKIAHAAPFAGAPRLQNPAMYGASPEKPILYRIPVLGERPIKVTAVNLPEGLSLNERGFLTGSCAEGDYTVTLCAENALGKDTKPLTLEIHPNHIQLTPLLGFTSWNAYVQYVRQEDMALAAKVMDESGLAEYGYSFINTDSSWQGSYGGQYDAIQPNEKFPDMQGLIDDVHSRGFKFGIYSTPMREAWGKAPESPNPLPGCTRGEADDRFSKSVFGIGVERMEKNNVRQWTEWGVDYLKYDWRPNEGVNADLMKQELLKSSRDIAFCVTVQAKIDYADYWKKNCTSWRCNRDSMDFWDVLMDVFKTYDPWIPHIGKGHFFDLDMLELGSSGMNALDHNWERIGDLRVAPCQLTEDEQIVAFTMRAFLMSPIQISSHLDLMNEFERNLYCNEEILAIHRDALTKAATVKLDEEDGERHLKVYEKELADGSRAEAIFNIGETDVTYTLPETEQGYRDVWAKEDFSDHTLTLPPHSVRVVKIG